MTAHEENQDPESSAPSSRPSTVLVTGAAGFIGRHVAEALLREGVRVRALVRPTHDVAALEALGYEVRTGDVTDPDTLHGVLEGCQACFHSVGIVRERRGEGVTFERLHVEATRNLVEAATAARVGRFILVSALGASADAPTRYHRSKYEGEKLLEGSGLEAVILRPGVVYGPGDGFTRRLVRLIENVPLVVPVVGQGWNRLQPMAIEDFAACAVRAVLDPDLKAGVYNLGGPEPIAFVDFLDLLMEILGRSRLKLHLFISLLYLVVPILEAVCANPPLTMDELRMLRGEYVCIPDSRGGERNDADRLLGRPQTDLEAGLRAHLVGASGSSSSSHS